MDVYVIGSNAKFLSKDIITEFAGRGDEIHMYPLSFSEFMTAYKGDKYEGLSEYMLYGGIPLVVLRDGQENKASALENLFSEIYVRDIQKRNKVRNIGELEDLLNIVSSAIGSLTNPEKLKNTFKSIKNSKITSTTIKKYLDYLEDSFLIESAQRYDIKGKVYIETPKKYYFSDNMSRIITSIILLMAMGFSGCGFPRRNTDNIDGGVVTRNSGEDSPKVIESTDIISFNCELSFIATVFDEENELEGKVYKMSAALEDGTVKAKIDWHDRSGNGDKAEFEADVSFMSKLQEIVSKYDLAKHNGYTHHVSGLPDIYGDYIDIKYASEESIYESDNQSGFLKAEAAMELIDLFLSFNI